MKTAEKRKNIEKIYNLVNTVLKNANGEANLINCGKTILKMISNLVKQKREYLNQIRSIAATAFVSKNEALKKFENLNQLVKPLIKSMSEPNFILHHELCSKSLLIIFAKLDKNVHQKIVKSLLSQYCEEVEITLQQLFPSYPYPCSQSAKKGLQTFFVRLLNFYFQFCAI